MIDSYDIGDKLTADDFVSDYYMPMGAYQYVEVTDINGDKVELTYYTNVGSNEDVVYVTKDQMARMLGWQDDPIPGATDDEVALYNMQMDVIIGDDAAQEVTDEAIIDTVQNAPTLEEDGNAELLDTEDGEPAVYVEKEGETVVRAYVFSDKEACRAAYQARK